jgi:hypothetical protein
VAMSLQSMPLSSHGLLPCISVILDELLIRIPPTGFRDHPNLELPHLNMITSAKTLFLNKFTF